MATNNTEGLLFARREQSGMAEKVQVIWTSPPLPESAILVRKDLDPAVKAKLRDFFLHYGQGADGAAQRKVMHDLTYAGFMPADDSYLDPVRLMVASDDLARAKRSGDSAKIAVAQKAMDAVKALAASRPKAPAGA